MIRHQGNLTVPDPKVSGLIDPDLFERLGGSDPQAKLHHQAALILHEALYLLGVELGQTNSRWAQSLTRRLLSRDTYPSLGISDGFAFEMVLESDDFANYPLLFIEKPDVLTSGVIAPNSPESRLTSNHSLRQKVIQRAVECNDGKPLTPLDPIFCGEHGEFDRPDELTDEEAFMLYVRTQIARNDVYTTLFDRNNHLALNVYCGEIQRDWNAVQATGLRRYLYSYSRHMGALQDKAKNYCDGLKPPQTTS